MQRNRTLRVLLAIVALFLLALPALAGPPCASCQGGRCLIGETAESPSPSPSCGCCGPQDCPCKGACPCYACQRPRLDVSFYFGPRLEWRYPTGPRRVRRWR
ncbi:MAG TPA: hypothetical protein VK395_22345 [Gemmataceae bacterium]|nr:hypothetical protein [Gemmataceae bacterium]